MKALLHALASRWSRLPTWLRRVLLVMAVLAFAMSIVAAGVFQHYASHALTYDMSLIDRDQNETLVQDARGELIGSVGEIDRELLSLKQMSPLLIQAVIATEDARFYSHPGFDIVGLTRAAIANFTAGGVKQGGSTITQQLARNAFGLDGRSYERKFKELFLAMRLEGELSKEEILTHYLNRIYLGKGFYGVGAAARGYFNKEAAELTLAEAATLAAIIKAPVTYNPITRPDLAKQKRDLTHQRMVDAGFISAETATAAEATPITVVHDKTKVRTGYILAAARAEFLSLGMQPGKPASIRSSLRLDWQRQLDEMVRVHLAALDKDGKKELQGAVLVIDNRSGAILAMQGGRDFVASPFNRALDGHRPAGTAMFPLVYATAFSLFPDVVDKPLLDGPLDNRYAMVGGMTGTLGEWGTDGAAVNYAGTITPLDALLEGRTAATVRFAVDLGLGKIHDVIQGKLIESPIRTEASFTLGQSAVSPVELARAYTVIANQGSLCTKPRILASYTLPSTAVIDPAAARKVRAAMITGMTRPQYRVPLQKYGLANKGIAGYGGVSYRGTDAWFIGSDRRLTCLVWIGHDTDAPIAAEITAAVTTLPLWAEVFQLVTSGKPQGWNTRSELDEIHVLPGEGGLSDQPVVPLIPPKSPTVIGFDAYAQSVPSATPGEEVKN